jgi:hypothetical protein
VLLTTFTPLELVPVSLGNLPRWGFWLLIFPVAQRLKAQVGRRWGLLPWLLWAPLLLLQLLVFGFWFSTPEHRTYAAFRKSSWTQVLWPFEKVFAQTGRWRTGAVEYRRENTLVVRQNLPSRWGAEARRVILTPIMPGLQWCVPIPYDSLLKAPWQVVDTVAVRKPEQPDQ